MKKANIIICILSILCISNTQAAIWGDYALLQKLIEHRVPPAEPIAEIFRGMNYLLYSQEARTRYANISPEERAKLTGALSDATIAMLKQLGERFNEAARILLTFPRESQEWQSALNFMHNYRNKVGYVFNRYESSGGDRPLILDDMWNKVMEMYKTDAETLFKGFQAIAESGRQAALGREQLTGLMSGVGQAAQAAWQQTPEGRLHSLWNKVPSMPTAISSRLAALKKVATPYVQSFQSTVSPILDPYILNPLAQALAKLGSGVSHITPPMAIEFLQNNFPILSDTLQRMDPVKRNQYIGAAITAAGALTALTTYYVGFKWYNRPAESQKAAEAQATPATTPSQSMFGRISQWWYGQ